MNIKEFPRPPDAQCQKALQCFFDITEQELNVYRALLNSGPATARGIAVMIDKDRSTAYRSVTPLVEMGLVKKETRKQEGGGIYHLYKARDPYLVQEMLREKVDSWYELMKDIVKRTGEDLSP